MTLSRLFCGLCALPTPLLASSLPPVDFVSLYLAERHAAPSADAVAARDDAAWGEILLTGGPLPSTPYTEPAPFDPAAVDDAFKRAAAKGDRPGRPLYWLEAWRILQWDLGYTKARPVDVGVPFPLLTYGSPHAGFNATKGGVSADLFSQSLILFGERHSTVAAKYAVAAQVLRDRLSRTPEEAHERRNLRADVLARYLDATSLADLPPTDLAYLRHLLEAAIDSHAPGGMGHRGLRPLATPFRIARVAAAYRDNQGYITPPCTADYRNREGIASIDPAQGPLCFVDAHDRAVHTWYLGEFRRQAMASEASEPRHSPLATALALLAPLGILLDIAAAAEFIEATAAEDTALAGSMEEEDALAYERRTANLLCRF